MSRSEKRSVLFGVTIDYQLRYHDGLYERLADDGWEVHLVAGDGPIGDRFGEHPGVTRHVLDMARAPNPVADLRGLVQWMRLLNRVRPDLIVVGTPKAGLLGSIAGMLARVPGRVYELHGLRLESASGTLRVLLRTLEKVSCAASTRVIAVGASLRDRALSERLAPSAKVDVLGAGSPNGVDVERFRRASADTVAKTSLRTDLGIPEDAQVVSFVGRLTADKGLETLTVAMAGAEERNRAWLLVVGGIDDRSGLEGEQRLRKTVPRLVLVGEVDDVAPYLAISDVFCLPSRREGLPTVVLEAFAADVPVVATSATGIVDLVSHHETGRLSPIDDGAALKRQLLDAFDDREGSLRMAASAAQLVADRFSRETVQRAWTDTLERMWASKHR
ncbi:glycosyltransferase family 4 protein [Microbacterium sp. TWP3-1-2b2]|uniref:glycosyltransferase family 4 protein n=1 Tax=Microbacterium sp. TWP3-1-2b2 TaxID=2804651 RepID=UPI003CEFFFC0